MDEAPEYYVWEVPGKPVRVCLSHQAIDHLLTEAMRGLGLLPRHGAEVGGLLLGTVEAGEIPTTRVEEVIPVPIEYAFGPFYAFSENDKAAFRELLRQWQPPSGRPMHAVGFYRTGTREPMALSQHDLWLFTHYFRDPSEVALVIRPRAMRSSTAGFFIREQGQIHAESSYLEFPMKSHATAVHAASRPAPEPEPDPPPAASDEAPAEAPMDVPLPAFLSGPPPREKREWRWWKRAAKEVHAVLAAEAMEKPARRQPLWASYWALIPILVCVYLVVGILGFALARGFRPAPGRQAAPPRDPYALSLLVVEYGDNLCLTWDRSAPAIAHAERAVLAISDGAQSQSLDIEQAVLRRQGFSVTYHRVTDRVTFRMEVFLKNRRSVSETWEFGGSGPATPETPGAAR
jgi:hypothetical protein